MAFLELDESGTTTSPITIRAPVRNDAISFSRLEWTVVGLARHDAARTFPRPAFIDKFLRLLLGEVRDARLANPRLEALRRTALAVRRWGVRLPGDVVEAFEGAGFSRAQLATLIHSVELDLVARRNGRLA